MTVISLLIALFLEQSRGAFAMTLAFGIGPAAIFMKLSLRKIIIYGVYFVLFAAIFSSFQFIRNADSALEEVALIFGLVTSGDFYKYLTEPIANYIATPILNAGLNIDIANDFWFFPNETLRPLVPSMIRDGLLDSAEKDYGALINEAFNTTTYVTPFVRDYGLVGGFMVINAFLFYCNYVFAKARYGSVEHIIKLSPLMMCLTLSFFTSYITSLVTILFILVSGPVARRMMH
jgi:oligosaccharide repeat unit polymerase